jgi:hypothetical protein
MEQLNADVLLKNQCPYCAHTVEVGGHLVGEMINCPNASCGKIFRIAVPEGETAQRETPAMRVETDLEGEALSSRASSTEAISSEAISSEAISSEAISSETLSTELPVSDETQLYMIHPAFLRRQPLKALAVAAAGLAGLVALTWWAAGGPAEGSFTDGEYVAAMPAWLLGGLGAILAGGAALLFASWWLQSRFTTITVTSKRTTYREGFFSRATSEVQHNDVRNLQVDQTLWQRILGIGDIAISSSGTDGMEIHANGIAAPDRIAEVIRRYE